jgi:hypothetical protein
LLLEWQAKRQVKGRQRSVIQLGAKGSEWQAVSGSEQAGVNNPVWCGKVPNGRQANRMGLNTLEVMGKIGDTWRVETSTKTGETDQGVTVPPPPRVPPGILPGHLPG